MSRLIIEASVRASVRELLRIKPRAWGPERLRATCHLSRQRPVILKKCKWSVSARAARGTGARLRKPRSMSFASASANALARRLQLGKAPELSPPAHSPPSQSACRRPRQKHYQLLDAAQRIRWRRFSHSTLIACLCHRLGVHQLAGSNSSTRCRTVPG